MSKLTPHQFTMLTLKELARRKYVKEKGKIEADSYIIEQQGKALKRKSKIRAKCYRGY